MPLLAKRQNPLIVILACLCGMGALGKCPDDFNSKVRALNQFAAPAQDPSTIGGYAEECEAVLGPIPKVFDCGQAPKLPHYGKDGPTHLQGPQQHPDEARLSVLERGNVTWVLMCQNTGFLQNGKFVSDNESGSGLVGLIGYNTITGESCFFKSHLFDRQPHPGPSSSGSQQNVWLDPKGMIGQGDKCILCHIKGGPFQISEALNQPALGGDGKNGTIPTNLGSALTGGKLGPYRVIGSEVNRIWKYDITGLHEPMTVQPLRSDGSADRTCTRCHIIPNTREYIRLARNAFDPHPDSGFKAFMPPEDFGEGKLTSDQRKKIFDPFWKYELSYPVFYGNREHPSPQYAARAEQHQKEFRAGVKILTPCPNPSRLKAAEIKIANEKSARGITAKWNFSDLFNQRSGIKSRNDIRFRVTVHGPNHLECVFEDLQPIEKFGSEWQVHLPVPNNSDFSFEITPVRYCFDLTGTTQSPSVAIRFQDKGIWNAVESGSDPPQASPLQKAHN